MHFLHIKRYGKDRFYPVDSITKRFIEAFRHSSGMRKSLTLDQINIMKEVGVPYKVLEHSIQGEENVIAGDKGL